MRSTAAPHDHGSGARPLVGLALLFALSPGCYLSHGAAIDPDAGASVRPPPPDAARDSGAPVRPPPPDAGPLCSPGDCDDADPCTRDACDPARGCRSEPVPDGTSCAEGALACDTAWVCRAGACVAAMPDDGSPCDDGRGCTVDDACAAGACVGVEGPSEPSEEGVARLFGAGGHSAATHLDTGDILISDELPLAYTVLRVGDDGRLARREVTVDRDAWRLGVAYPLSGGRFLANRITRGSGPQPWFEHQVDEDGAVTRAAIHRFSTRVGQEHGVVYQDRFYRCDGSELAIESFTVPSTGTHRMPIDGCGRLDVDEATRSLLVSTSDRLVRYDLADPDRPTDRAVLVEGRLRFWATLGGRLVFQAQLASGSASEDIEILELEGEPRRRVIHRPDPPPLGLFGAALAHDTLLVGGSYGQMELWRIDERGDLTVLDTFSVSANPRLLSAARGVAFVSRTNGPVSVFRLDASRTSIESLTGPGHGRARGALRRAAGRIWALGARTTQRLDLSDPARPAIDAGGTDPSYVAVRSISTPPRYLDLVPGSSGPRRWLDVEDPSAPRLLGEVADPVSLGPFVLDPERGWLVDVVREDGDLEVRGFDLRDYDPTRDTLTAGVRARFALEAPYGTRSRDLAIDRSGDRAVVRLTHAEGGSSFYVLSIAGGAPVLEGRASVPEVLETVRLAGEHALVTADAAGVVTLYAYEEEALRPVSSVAVEGYRPRESWDQLLYADPDVAVVFVHRPDTNTFELHWIDLSAAPIAVAAVTPIEDQVFAAIAEGGHLILAGDDAIHAFRIPCFGSR